MRGATVALLSYALLSCAGRGTLQRGKINPEAVGPQPAQVMSLIGRFSLAHACPVDNHIVTAAHVAVKMNQQLGQVPMGYVFQQGSKRGYVRAASDPQHGPSWFEDLAYLDLVSGDRPEFNKLATTVAEGENIYWYEYDYSSAGNMLTVKHRNAKVAKIIAGHFSIDGDPEEGSSGGCVFNESGDVVGIISFGLAVQRNNISYSQWAGVAVLYTEEWKH